MGCPNQWSEVECPDQCIFFLSCYSYTRDAASQCKHKPASPVEPHSERPREGVEPGVRVHRKLDEDEDNVGGATANDSAAVNAELTLLQKLLVKPLGERGIPNLVPSRMSK